MRDLNKKQKKVLTEWFNANKDKVGIGFDMQYNDFPYEVYQRLVAINDHETIVQNINRFVSDLAMNDAYGK